MQLFKLLHSIVHVQMIGANIVWFHERSLITMPFLHSIIKQSVHGNSQFVKHSLLGGDNSRPLLRFSTSSMVSGRHRSHVSGSVQATTEPKTAKELKMTLGMLSHTSSSIRIRGVMATAERETAEFKPIPFCLQRCKRISSGEKANFSDNACRLVMFNI